MTRILTGQPFRCKLSPSGRSAHTRDPDRKGTAQHRLDGRINVLWDGLKTPLTYAGDFIEKISEAAQ